MKTELQQYEQKNTGRHDYQSKWCGVTWLVIILCIIFFPVGLYAQDQQSALEVNPPDIKVGDVFINEYIDPSHPENNYKTERTVIFADGGIIELSVINLNSKSGKKRLLKFNKEWNLIATRNADNSGLDYSPPLKYFEFPLSPGKTWQQTTTETNIKTGAIRKHKILGVVGEWEDITVPAGTFHALKVILNTEVVNPVTGEKSTGTDTSWYAPDVKRTIKSEVTSRNETDNTEQQSVSQLISFYGNKSNNLAKNTRTQPQAYLEVDTENDRIKSAASDEIAPKARQKQLPSADNLQQEFLKIVDSYKESATGEQSNIDNKISDKLEGLGDVADSLPDEVHAGVGIAMQAAELLAGPTIGYLATNHQSYLKSRNKELCQLLPSSLNVQNWQGKIKNMGASNGVGYLTVLIDEDVDLYINNLPMGEDNYYAVAQMKENDKVILSGSFIKNKDSCINTNNNIPSQSLVEPEFNFTLESIGSGNKKIVSANDFIQGKVAAAAENINVVINVNQAPDEQKKFAWVIDLFNRWYETANNPLEKGAIPYLRSNYICNDVKEGKLSATPKNWVGTIESTNNISVNIATLKDKTEKNDVLLKSNQVTENFQIGDSVLVNGSFKVDEKNCFKELSMTESGGMDAPEFEFTFKPLEKFPSE